jgi:hypothetical protein
MKKHNHSSDDRPIQYRGKHSRHSRGHALTNFASDRNTGATCLKPSRRTIEALAPAPSSLVSLFELKAATDLAELFLKRDRVAEAYKCLSAALDRTPAGIVSPAHQRALLILNQLQSGTEAVG